MAVKCSLACFTKLLLFNSDFIKLKEKTQEEALKPPPPLKNGKINVQLKSWFFKAFADLEIISRNDNRDTWAVKHLIRQKWGFILLFVLKRHVLVNRNVSFLLKVLIKYKKFETKLTEGFKYLHASENWQLISFL